MIHPYTPVAAPTASPLELRHMPVDYGISVQATIGRERRTERAHRMRGFEDRYTDIIDYIVGITEEIWDRKNIGYLHHCYASDIFKMEDAGVFLGRGLVIADTSVVLQSLPDTATFADDCIWAGDDEIGFHTSHRVMLVARNTGPSELGPPTGRRVSYWVIANCVAKDNFIFEEWELSNPGMMMQQLGLDVDQMARSTAALTPATHPFAEYIERIDRFRDAPPADAPAPSSDTFDPDSFERFVFHSIWNRRHLQVIDQVYASTIRFHGTTNRELYGRVQVTEYVLSLLGTFPDLALTVDEVYWMGNDRDGYKISTRWSAVGTHLGHALYGPPTGREVFIWGLVQHTVHRGTITDEWSLFNEYHVMQELYRPG